MSDNDYGDYPISFETSGLAIVEEGENTPEYEAVTELRAKIEEQISKIDDLNRIIENQRGQIQRAANEESEFADRLKDAVENDEIDSDLAKEFADIFGIEMTKEYSITITATWSGTVTVPFGDSIDDLDIAVNYPEPSYSCDFEMDVDEDSLDWDVQENF